jgi:hypothetical protein
MRRLLKLLPNRICVPHIRGLCTPSSSATHTTSNNGRYSEQDLDQFAERVKTDGYVLLRGVLEEGTVQAMAAEHAPMLAADIKGNRLDSNR